MDKVKYLPDGSPCSVEMYRAAPDTFRGNIICDDCEEKAWFVRGYSSGKREKPPCFAAHHTEGCDKKIKLVVDDEGGATVGDPSSVTIDLDKHKKQSIEIPLPPTKAGKENKWGATRTQARIGDYPEQKSLRQILTRLSQAPGFPDDYYPVKMVADAGRVVLEGDLRDFLVSQDEIKNAPVGEAMVYWGRINNVNTTKEGLWLNCGNWRIEPSIFIGEEDLQEDMLEDFRLQDFEDLQGADFIVVGVRYGGTGKPCLRFSFTKYIAFRKWKAVDIDE